MYFDFYLPILVGTLDPYRLNKKYKAVSELHEKQALI